MVVASFGGMIAYASHSWGVYHWSRTANPFNLKLSDNVSANWDSFLATASSDWSLSNALDTTVVSGSINPKNCKPVKGGVQVCSSRYGFNGWLGVASIWISGDHITQSTVKLNDTYFNTATYNKPEWRNFVMCQEVGHTFGLDHQDEVFTNANLGTCMDYTNNPSGLNEHPNLHDYDQLETIYTHLDSITTIGSKEPTSNGGADLDHPSQWGREIKRSSDGKSSLHVKNLGKGDKVFTFVIWAN